MPFFPEPTVELRVHHLTRKKHFSLSGSQQSPDMSIFSCDILNPKGKQL